ncbi:hypothetical protein OH76DRAFT_1255341 [Lentinus brumalis]|uniref:Uncharacterized protein n=1 Tax=Lentinus brumalis TaxID=2498619 RepID=A0A371CRI0_9APHY|nr:hypothetical protein OH76DRAFT_1255341 [Polyporus brumalis]
MLVERHVACDLCRAFLSRLRYAEERRGQWARAAKEDDASEVRRFSVVVTLGVNIAVFGIQPKCARAQRARNETRARM